jgi:hypothetical protein
MSAAQYNEFLLSHASPASSQAVAKLRGVAKKRASPEEDLHRLVFAWIFAMQRTHPILDFMMHVPNGGGRSKGEAGKLKAMGVRRGVPDVLCPFKCSGFNGFACELKAPNGKCSPEQNMFLTKAKNDGWLVGVCFTFDEFVSLANLYLGVLPLSSMIVATNNQKN